MESMEHLSFWADLDLWMRPETHPDDRVQYYSYSLSYVDDILCIYDNEDSLLQSLHPSFLLKLVYCKLDMYLGTSYIGPDYIMKYGHGQKDQLNMSI